MNCIALFKIIKYTIIKDTEKELVKFNSVKKVYYNQICRRADAVIMISVWGRNGKNTVFADKRGFPH